MSEDQGIGRRGFVRTVGLGVGALAAAPASAGERPSDAAGGAAPASPAVARALADPDWPSLRHYDAAHLLRVALPIGGIGTGTVSLGGRGDLRDLELMNRPAKGFVPPGAAAPFFALRVRQRGSARPSRAALEGPLPAELYEGSHGCARAERGPAALPQRVFRGRLSVRPA